MIYPGWDNMSWAHVEDDSSVVSYVRAESITISPFNLDYGNHVLDYLEILVMGIYKFQNRHGGVAATCRPEQIAWQLLQSAFDSRGERSPTLRGGFWEWCEPGQRRSGLRALTA